MKNENGATRTVAIPVEAADRGICELGVVAVDDDADAELVAVEAILRPLGLEDQARDAIIGHGNGFMDRLDSEALMELSAGNARNADLIYAAMNQIASYLGG